MKQYTWQIMENYISFLNQENGKLMNEFEKETIKSLYKSPYNIEDINVCLIPPLTTTLRVNTWEYNYEDVFSKIKEINQTEWCGNFEILQIPPFKDVIFVKGHFNDCPEKLNESVLIDIGCVNAVLRGSDVFSPGIIAMSKHLKIGTKVSVYTNISNKCTKNSLIFDPSKELFLGNGVLQINRHELIQSTSKKGVAIKMTDSLIKQPSFGALEREQISSMVFPQNLPSIIVGYVVDPQPQDFILDMCASPGGKTTHIAQLSHNKSRIIAIDKGKVKVERLKQNIERFKFTNISPYIYDSCKLCEVGVNSQKEPPFPPETFDKILLDGPCSGLGQRPYLHSKFTCSKQLDAFVIQQKKLFEQAVMLLKRGGFLVYSTCTILVAENENLVAWALKRFKGTIKLVPHTPHISHYIVNSELTDEQAKFTQRFDPILHFHSYLQKEGGSVSDEAEHLLLDSIGFFIAKFTKL